MPAHDILRSQVRLTVNLLYVGVFCVLPFLWFGECKNALSLVFKNIKASSDHEIAGYYFPTALHVPFVLIGLWMYNIHRRWWVEKQQQRTENLNCEPDFTTTRELPALKQNILYAVQKVAEEKISVPFKNATSDIKPMRILRTMTCDDFNKQMENIEKETRERAASSNVESDRPKIPKTRKPSVAPSRHSKSNK